MRDPDCLFSKIVAGEVPSQRVDEDDRYEGDPLRLPWTPAPGDPDEIGAAADALR
jgi:hypothetical protein